MEKYSYTPASDPTLIKEGVTSFKQVVIVAERKAGNICYMTTHTFLIHRSRHAFRNRLMGISLFGFFLLLLAIIGIKTEKKI